MPEEKAFKANIILLFKMPSSGSGATVKAALKQYLVVCSKTSERSLIVHILGKHQWGKK